MIPFRRANSPSDPFSAPSAPNGKTFYLHLAPFLESPLDTTEDKTKNISLKLDTNVKPQMNQRQCNASVGFF